MLNNNLGQQWNKEKFLLKMVGDGPDAFNRATDLANKFEQHVFNSTSTKEEYAAVVLSRMQQIQNKRQANSDEPLPIASSSTAAVIGGMSLSRSPSMPPLGGPVPSDTFSSTGSVNELTEVDKEGIRQVVTKLAPILPLMEQYLQAAIKNKDIDVDLVRKYSNLRSILQKQIGLIQSNVFILSVHTANTLEEQIRASTNMLKSALKQSPSSSTSYSAGHTHGSGLLGSKVGLAASNSVPSLAPRKSTESGLEPFEEMLLMQLRKEKDLQDRGHIAKRSLKIKLIPLDRFSGTDIELTKRAQPPGQMQTTLVVEAEALALFHSVKIGIERCFWGYSCLIDDGSHRVRLQFSLDYPNEQFYIVPWDDFSIRLKGAIERGAIPIFPPSTLSALLNIIKYFEKLEPSFR